MHAELILQKVEEGLTAQRIYQDLRLEQAFAGSYQSVKRYVHQVRQTDPKLVQRIEMQPREEVQVDFGTGPDVVGAEGQKPDKSLGAAHHLHHVLMDDEIAV